jgi:hypothetical protein
MSKAAWRMALVGVVVPLFVRGVLDVHQREVVTIARAVVSGTVRRWWGSAKGSTSPAPQRTTGVPSKNAASDTR